MFSSYSLHSIVRIEGFVQSRNLYFDQTNGDCFVQVTTGDAEHYRSCEMCKEKIKLVSEKMQNVRNFKLIEANFSEKENNGIYARFNAGCSTSPFTFLQDVLQRDIVRTRQLGYAKTPFAYGDILYE